MSLMRLRGPEFAVSSSGACPLPSSDRLCFAEDDIRLLADIDCGGPRPFVSVSNFRFLVGGSSLGGPIFVRLPRVVTIALALVPSSGVSDVLALTFLGLPRRPGGALMLTFGGGLPFAFALDSASRVQSVPLSASLSPDFPFLEGGVEVAVAGSAFSD